MPLLNYSTIEKSLKIRFKKRSLLKLALTHSSYLQTTKIKTKQKSNETLEFLGDAVLELITREHLFKKFPQANEGDLSELKKMYTNSETLYKIGRDLGLGKFLIMDKGEELTGGRNRQSNIAGCLEAIIGALYVDRGLRYVEKFVYRMILTREIDTYEDYKSLLNLWAMKNQHKISYRVGKELGPPHQRTFYVELYVDGKKTSRGKGGSKKVAEQEASKIFFQKMTNEKV